MTVNSLLSFSVAAYSGKQLLAKWKNPNQAAGKPYSGVYIRYSTSGNPGSGGGTQIYKGTGNNISSGGDSQVYLNMPSLNTTYHISCTPYVSTSIGELLGSHIYTTCKTGSQITKTFTSSQSYTVPAGYTIMDAFLVGGGSSGVRGSGSPSGHKTAGIGGSGGKTTTKKNISVKANESLNFVIGSGGASIPGIKTTGNPDMTKYPSNKNCSNNGGESYISRGSTKLASATGGTASSGGSGGGAVGGTIDAGGEGNYSPIRAGNGGSNGSNGASVTTSYGVNVGGTGQGSTTRAFGESTGTIYAGGGGGGGETGARLAPSSGGSGQNGGGSGGTGSGFGSNGTSGTNAVANTGSGGGGSGGSQGNKGRYGNQGDAGSGGSGVIIIRLR